MLLEYGPTTGARFYDGVLSGPFCINLDLSPPGRENYMNRSLLIAALVAVGLTACGKKEEKPAPPPAPAPTAPAPAPTPAPTPAPAATPTPAPDQKSDAGTPGGMATTPAAPAGATGSTGMSGPAPAPTNVQDSNPAQKK